VNILNLLAALAAAHARGVPLPIWSRQFHISSLFGALSAVTAASPSRDCGLRHTDDALRNLIALSRQMTAQSGGRVITLFGCGGDRDRHQTAKMGRAAGEEATLS